MPVQLLERSPRLLVIDGETITVRVRESTRARRLRIRLGPRRPVEAIVPRRVTDRQLDRFLAEHRPWIARKLREARAIAARPPRLGLARPGVVWLELEPIPVRPSATPDAVERWYRREARRRISLVAEREAARLGVEYGAIGIRDPRTRWGSCSSRGNLSFSWRLVIAPARVLEYVVIHELCHLRELNHSKRFYSLLEAVRPAWREEAGWLREHGQELHDYAIQSE
jgi:predicted metal-dependent hydrolase